MGWEVGGIKMCVYSYSGHPGDKIKWLQWYRQFACLIDTISMGKGTLQSGCRNSPLNMHSNILIHLLLTTTHSLLFLATAMQHSAVCIYFSHMYMYTLIFSIAQYGCCLGSPINTVCSIPDCSKETGGSPTHLATPTVIFIVTSAMIMSN